MASTTITFSKPLNTSIQIGDTAYYVSTGSSGSFTVNASNVVEIGPVSAITNPNSNSPTITINPSLIGNGSISNVFILFSKTNCANMSSILGYYNEVKVASNGDGSEHEEIFQVGMDYFVSSK